MATDSAAAATARCDATLKRGERCQNPGRWWAGPRRQHQAAGGAACRLCTHNGPPPRPTTPRRPLCVSVMFVICSLDLSERQPCATPPQSALHKLPALTRAPTPGTFSPDEPPGRIYPNLSQPPLHDAQPTEPPDRAPARRWPRARHLSETRKRRRAPLANGHRAHGRPRPPARHLSERANGRRGRFPGHSSETRRNHGAVRPTPRRPAGRAPTRRRPSRRHLSETRRSRPSAEPARRAVAATRPVPVRRALP